MEAVSVAGRAMWRIKEFRLQRNDALNIEAAARQHFVERHIGALRGDAGHQNHVDLGVLQQRLLDLLPPPRRWRSGVRREG